MRFKILIFAAAWTAGAAAQTAGDGGLAGPADTGEDSAQVITLDSVLAMQQRVVSSKNAETRINKIWGRTKYRNIGFNSSTLKSKEEVALGTGRSEKLKFDSDWGVSLTFGTNYRLHRPIANIVSIGLDYTWFDVNLNHFKIDDDASYNSAETFTTDGGDDDDTYHYMPWQLEKYEANYGMMLGPSVTVAPFVSTGIDQLAALKFQVYMHFGYRFSAMFFKNAKDKDTNPDIEDDDDAKDVRDDFKGEWGHGFYTKFGFNVSWKAIGIGYEHSSGSLKYKSFSTSNYGKEKTKFSLGTNKVYIQIRI